MRKNYLLLPLLFISVMATAQKKKRSKTPPPSSAIVTATDTTLLGEMKDNVIDNIPVITLDDNDLGDGSTQNVSSALTAGRDPFFNAVSFNFRSVRYKIRGYDAENFATYMNGIPMESLDNGFTPFGLWGGLNDVMRNRDLSIGLRYNTFSFGDIGSSISIDSRASKQRKQTQFGYAMSNTNYTHRFSITHNTGISKKGWAFTFSGSRRYAAEGYAQGTYYDGWSYFLGVDKKLGQKHLLSLVAFGAPTENGKQGPSVTEIQDITGDRYYNPYWGYQNGKKRNANIAKSNQPYIILTHDFRISNKSSLVTAAGYSFGDRSSTRLDFSYGRDHRPDYYRYLPSFQGDATLRQQVTNVFMNNQNVSQIDWARLYDDNRSSTETFNGVTGKRSRYLIEENVINTKRFNFNTVYNTRLSNHVELTAGASFQSQKNNYYKKINDLLGGDYFADINQFAERSYPNNDSARQPNLNNPNHVARVGDRYNYDYEININKTTAFLQGLFKFNKVDFFVAAEGSNTQFWRVGNFRNGLFPTRSFGKSSVNSFNNYAIKGGVTYKLDGRNYFYVNGSYLTKAPFFENAYLSPRTRSDQQENVKSETVKSVEGAYILNAPKLKIHLGGFYTEFENGLNVIPFYSDFDQNFGNLALSNINKLHFGGEFGFDAKILPNVTLDGAASIGRYYYNSRQLATTTLDNDNSILGRDTVYSQDYRVGGTPQEAYSLGITYRSPNFWSVSLTGNYFDQMWLDPSPIRLTYKAIQDVPYKSDLWNQIRLQKKFDPQYTVDFFGSYSWKLPRKWGFKKATFLIFNLGVSNLLNNRNIVTGGFEQLRYDFTDKNLNKFPPKYYYAYGVNYFASATIRF